MELKVGVGLVGRKERIQGEENGVMSPFSVLCNKRSCGLFYLLLNHLLIHTEVC